MANRCSGQMPVVSRVANTSIIQFLDYSSRPVSWNGVDKRALSYRAKTRSLFFFFSAVLVHCLLLLRSPFSGGIQHRQSVHLFTNAKAERSAERPTGTHIISTHLSLKPRGEFLFVKFYFVNKYLIFKFWSSNRDSNAIKIAQRLRLDLIDHRNNYQSRNKK